MGLKKSKHDEVILEWSIPESFNLFSKRIKVTGKLASLCRQAFFIFSKQSVVHLIFNFQKFRGALLQIYLPFCALSEKIMGLEGQAHKAKLNPIKKGKNILISSRIPKKKITIKKIDHCDCVKVRLGWLKVS